MFKFIIKIISLIKIIYLFFYIIMFFIYLMLLEMILMFSLTTFIFFIIMVLYIINFFKMLLKFFYSNVFKLIEGFYTLTIYSYVRFIYYYFRFRIFLISFVLFLSIFTFIFYSMDSKIPTAEEAFIKVIIGYIFSWCIICITIIVLNVLKILFTILFKWLCKKLGNIYIFFCDLFDEIFTYDNFLRLYTILLSFSKIIIEFRFRGSGKRFVTFLLNCLTRFSIILYKYIIGFIIKSIILLILEMLENTLSLVLFYVSLVCFMLSSFLVFLFNKFVSFLFYLWTSRIYIFTFGRIEGLIYRFWINNISDRFSYLTSNLESFYSVDVKKVGLFMIIINFISILITLICIFYSSSIYVVTIGLHMDVCFNFILNRCDGISFVSFFILSSFSIFYIISIIFFISCLFLSIILILRFYHCSLILFNKLSSFLLAILGCYFYFKSYIIVGVLKVDTKFIKESWDSIDDVFKYDELFANKVLEIQEDRLDKEDQKKDPNKFYYKRLFVNLVAILSFSFVFIIMFISYYYF